MHDRVADQPREEGIYLVHTQWLKCVGTQGNGVPAPLNNYRQIAFLPLQVRKNAQERQSLWHFCMHGASVQTDTTKLKWRSSVTLYVLTICNNKTQVNRLRKRKANMASNIHSHQHLMGPALMAGEPTLKMEFPHLRFSTATTAFMLALALPVTLISCFTIYLVVVQIRQSSEESGSLCNTVRWRCDFMPNSFDNLLGRIACTECRDVVARSMCPCLSVCLLDTIVTSTKTDEPIEMQFRLWT